MSSIYNMKFFYLNFIGSLSFFFLLGSASYLLLIVLYNIKTISLVISGEIITLSANEGRFLSFFLIYLIGFMVLLHTICSSFQDKYNTNSESGRPFLVCDFRFVGLQIVIIQHALGLILSRYYLRCNFSISNLKYFK